MLCLFERGVLFCVICVICLLCLIVVLLAASKYRFAVKIEFLATDPEARDRFPALPDFLRSSGS
jgi:ABC-type transport system involved in Fe-S cluster assembly fused permease/ATPase subunit